MSSFSYHFLFLVIIVFSLGTAVQKAGHLLGIFSGVASVLSCVERDTSSVVLMGFFGGGLLLEFPCCLDGILRGKKKIGETQTQC